jgi:hypothetical protein
MNCWRYAVDPLGNGLMQCFALPPQADALASSDWRAVRAIGSAASCGLNAMPAALESVLVNDAKFPGALL